MSNQKQKKTYLVLSQDSQLLCIASTRVDSNQLCLLNQQNTFACACTIFLSPTLNTTDEAFWGKGEGRGGKKARERRKKYKSIKYKSKKVRNKEIQTKNITVCSYRIVLTFIGRSCFAVDSSDDSLIPMMFTRC